MTSPIVRFPALCLTLLAMLLLTGCAVLTKTDDPLAKPLAGNEGAVFLSVTHAGGNVSNWDQVFVEEVINGRAGKEYFLQPKRLRNSSNTVLYTGSLKAGTYRVKNLTKFMVGNVKVNFDLGDDLQQLQFQVKADAVNDLGRLLVGGPFPGKTSYRESFLIQVTKKFISNKPYIERESPGYMEGKTVERGMWTGTEGGYEYSNYGRVVANGYDVLTADANDNIYTGNRMGSVLRIHENTGESTVSVSIFDTGAIDTVKSLLLIGDEMIVGGDMPSLPVVNLSSRKISELSTRGLETGSVEYLHKGPKDDLYAVICNKTRMIVQRCENRGNCEWNTVRSFERKRVLGSVSDDSICGGASYRKNLLIYVADDKLGNLVSTLDLASGSWSDQTIPVEPGTVTVNYDERIVVLRDFNSFAIGKILTFSDDGGKTWHDIAQPTTAATTTAPVFVNKDEGYIVSNNATLGEIFSLTTKLALLKTTDGGASWQVLNPAFSSVYKFYSLPIKDKLYAKAYGGPGQSAVMRVDAEGQAVKLLDAKPKIVE